MWKGGEERARQGPCGGNSIQNPRKAKTQPKSILLDQECDVLETLEMIKIQVIKVSFPWKKKVRRLEIFRLKITDDARSAKN